MTVAIAVPARSRVSSLIGLLGLQAGLAIAVSLVTARWLGPADRGVIVIATTSASLLMLIGSLGIATSGRVLLAQGDVRFSLSQQARIAGMITAWHLPMVSVVGWPLLYFTGAWRGWMPAIAFTVYATGLMAAYLGREALHGIGRHRQAVGGDLLTAGTQLAVLVAVWLSGQLSVLTVLTVMALTVWCQVAVLWLLLRSLREREDPAVGIRLKTLVTFSLPALAAALGQAFVIRGDRLILGTYESTATVGIYGVAATFSEVVWLGATGFSQLCFRYSAQGLAARVMRLRIANLVLTIAAAGLAAVVAQPVVHMVLGDAYAESVPIIWLLLIAAVLMSAYFVEAAALNGAGRLTVPARAAVTGSLALIVGCALLIPRFGPYGAAVASCLSYATMLSVVSWRTPAKVAAKGHR
jgi:O-antigen/teichoic acid export membrane protein